MSKPRMIQSQFGALSYSSGLLGPGQITFPGGATLQFAEGAGYLNVTRHNDEFFIPDKIANPTRALSADGLHFATFDYVDLRDLIEEKACMDDVTINVQRLKELPYPNVTFNMPPGNIEETLLVMLGNMEMEKENLGNVFEIHDAGFGPILPNNKGGLPFEVLYRENRQYVQDPSQNFVSPGQIGTQAGAIGDPTQTPTRFVGNYRLASRTIGGYPDIIVGPGITIIRVISMWPAARTVQGLKGLNAADEIAKELEFLSMRVEATFPALQVNIVGTQRALTATETATYYSNILQQG
jgi:hypothetical protein